MPGADCFGGESPPSPKRRAERGQMERKPFHNEMEVKRKMAKEIKRKLLLVTVILFLLFISSTYAALMPVVHAAEPNVQDKTMGILEDVVGINTEKYVIIRSSQLDNQYLSLSQKEADITLASDQGRLRVSCSFVNNMLRQIYLSDYEGDLSVEQPAIATADMAKGFLQRYQNYAGDSFYGDLASTLDNVDVSTNITKSAGNIKLEVLNSDNTILDYVWTFADENGVVAKSKNVILSYDQGQLKVFLNNWPLYKVVGTPKISSEEATAIALEASKNFSYEVEIDNATSTITGFNINPKSLGHAKLSYLNFPNQSLARGGDPFTLYPSWYVPLGFDKSYPGAVTGMTVSIWADTGEVSIMGPMVVGLSSLNTDEEKESAISAEAVNAEESSQESPASAPFVAVAVFTAIGGAVVSAKKPKFVGGRKLFKKSWVALLCGVILSSVILGAMPAAFADEHLPNSKARIYAALEGGGPFNSPAQIYDEQVAAYWVSEEIKNAFTYSGYAVSNDAGWGTRAEWIPSQIEADESGYDRAAVFHFGHLIEWNEVYADNYGNPIFANTTIYPKTGLGKHFFVFIWVCAQAQDHTSGMPVAWTHRDGTPGHPYMSSNGFVSPDGYDQCYIGFEGVSPMISDYHQTFEQQMTDPAKIFIQCFYNYSLKIGYSVKESLDRACLDFFGYTFTSSILNTGYTAWYSGDQYHDEDYYPGRMRVFGDGNIRIGQSRITLAANTAIAPTFYLDGVPHSLGTINLWSYPRQYTIEVSDVPCYEFDHFHYDEASGGWGSWWFQPLTISFDYSGTFTAVYTPIQQPLTISSSGSGHTDPNGTQMYDPFTYAHVEAFPNPGYDHYWLLNGRYAGSNPTIDVYMNGPQTLQAVFYPEQSHYFAAAIDSYDGDVYNPENIVGWQNDGQFATIYGYGPYQYYGWISAAMNKPATGHIYVYGSGYGPLYVYVSSNSYDWEFVSSAYSGGSYFDCGSYLSPFNYIKLTAEDPYSVYSLDLESVRVYPPGTYFTLTISSGSGGSTTPSPGTYQYTVETPVAVTANPNSGYVLDYWLLDGQNVGSQNPITVTMNSNHTLQANFRTTPYHWLTVDAYDAYLGYGYPLYPNIYIDGNYAGTGYAHIQVADGYHSVTVDEWVWNEYWYTWSPLYGFSDGYGNGDYRPIYSDTTITAWYLPW